MQFKTFYVYDKNGKYVGEVSMTDEYNAIKWAAGFYNRDADDLHCGNKPD